MAAKLNAKSIIVDASDGEESRDFALEIVNFAKSKNFPAQARNYALVQLPPVTGVTVSGPDHDGAITIHVGSP